MSDDRIPRSTCRSSQADFLLRNQKFSPSPCTLLTDELGTRLWGCCTPGPNGIIYPQALPEDAPGVSEVTQIFGFGPLPFDWFRSNRTEPFVAAGLQVTGIPPAWVIEVDGEGYLVVWDYVTSTLLRTTAPGEPAESLQVLGFIDNLMRLR